ncbi:MAG TPA: tetratricopeptide repeat protein [Candidatus Obscuribacterales bacterium]
MTVTAFQQANQLLREGKLEAAVIVYRQAIEQNPQFYGAYQNLGETLGKLGRLDEAVQVYRKAIELKPSAGWLQKELELLLEKLEKPLEAKASLTNELSFAVQEKPPFKQKGVTHNAVVQVESQPGELEKAIAAYRSANPQSLDFDLDNCYVEDALEQLGNFEKAIKEIFSSFDLSKTPLPHREINMDLETERRYYNLLNKHSPTFFYKNLYQLNLDNKNDIAVIIHGFYLDLWNELLG